MRDVDHDQEEDQIIVEGNNEEKVDEFINDIFSVAFLESNGEK